MSDQEQTRVVRTHTLLKSLVICNINIIVLLIFKLFHTNTDVFLTCLWRLQVFFSRVSMTSDQDGVKGDVCSAIAHFSLFSLRLYSNNMTQPLTRLILTVTVRDCDWWEEELNSPNTRIHMCTHCVCVCCTSWMNSNSTHTLCVQICFLVLWQLTCWCSSAVNLCEFTSGFNTETENWKDEIPNDLSKILFWTVMLECHMTMFLTQCLMLNSWLNKCDCVSSWKSTSCSVVFRTITVLWI